MYKPRRLNMPGMKPKKPDLKTGIRRTLLFVLLLVLAASAALVGFDIYRNRQYSGSRWLGISETGIPSPGLTLIRRLETSFNSSGEVTKDLEAYLTDMLSGSDEESEDKAAGNVQLDLLYVVGLMYRHAGTLSDEHLAAVRKALLGFRYWMTDSGISAVNYWSESRQILFSTAEYLAGQLYPDAVFTNAQLSGREHMSRAGLRILVWLAQRWEHGFSQWLSPESYGEIIDALTLLSELVEDEEIAVKSRIILDLVQLSLAVRTIDGTISSPSSLIGGADKLNASGHPFQETVRAMFSEAAASDGRIDAAVPIASVPAVIRNLYAYSGPLAVTENHGVSLVELNRFELGNRDLPGQLFQFGMQAYTNPETVTNIFHYINTYKMFCCEEFHNLLKYNYTLLRSTGMLAVLSRLIEPSVNGRALQSSTIYSFRTENYLLSTVQSYLPGSPAWLQHIWELSLGGDARIFTTHPAKADAAVPETVAAPDYWGGSGILPHSVQQDNVNLTMYRIPGRAGLLREEHIQFTHAYLPEAAFDEVRVTERAMFVRKNRGFAALIGGNPLKYQASGDGSRSDVIQAGNETWWILEAGSADEETFDQFVRRITANTVSYRDGILSYTTRNREYRLTWLAGLQVQGEPAVLPASRFNADGIPIEIPAGAAGPVRIEFEGAELVLDFHAASRTEQDRR